MEKTKLISPTKYAALSYCWGDPAITTNIFADGIKIPLTSNLADALQYLRKLGVSNIWADALCIHQADKQEKGLQIRNMTHIYSKADTNYKCWPEEMDDMGALIVFLMSLLDSHDDTALAQTTHICISMTSAPFPARQIPARQEVCRCCTIESCFQRLQRLLQRQYWKRRWILQETSVSYRHILLCGEAASTLDDMNRAITRCRKSHYWDVDTEKAYSWFKTTMEFRHSYQKDTKPSLYQAIALSRDFESTDPRDAIFSLLGLSRNVPSWSLSRTTNSRLKLWWRS